MMNFYNHHNSVSFKSHSIRVTFKICAVLGAQGIRATGFKRAQGNQHCAKSESHTNRVTFETNVIMMIVKVHPQGNQGPTVSVKVSKLSTILLFSLFSPVKKMMSFQNVNYVLNLARYTTFWFSSLFSSLAKVVELTF